MFKPKTASDFKPGMVFKSIHFKGDVTVTEVIEKDNNLKVTVHANQATETNVEHSWDEEWNLQHTIWGFDSGDYHMKHSSEQVKQTITDDVLIDKERELRGITVEPILERYYGYN
jgi:hypothetical protein